MSLTKALADFQVRTGGRSGRSTPQALRDVDSAVERVLGIHGNAAYLEGLQAVKELLRGFAPAGFQEVAAIIHLRKAVDAEIAVFQGIVTEAMEQEATVQVRAWLDANLPVLIEPDGDFNAVRENTDLRKIRRAVIIRQLLNEHRVQLDQECPLIQIRRIARSYLNAQGYWAPGQRCHFVAENCGWPGEVQPRQVSVIGGDGQAEAYCTAVFDRQMGTVGAIKHSIKVLPQGRILDPTYLQFFPGQEDRLPPIFVGSREDFRRLFGLD